MTTTPDIQLPLFPPPPPPDPTLLPYWLRTGEQFVSGEDDDDIAN